MFHTMKINPQANLKPSPRATIEICLLLGAVVVAVGLRYANLKGIPPALNQDEAVNGYDAYSLFRTGRDHLGHPFPFAGLESFGDWTSPLLTFLTIPFVGLLGLHTEVLRLVSATVGVLLVPIIYLLGCELWQRRSVGILAAWFIAVLPWHVHLSRWAIPPTMVPTMIALTILALVWSLRRWSNLGLINTAIIAGLTFASYPTMKLYVPLLVGVVLLIYWRSIKHLRFAAISYAILIFVVIAGPILYLSTFDPAGRARLDQVSIFRATHVDAPLLIRQYASYFSPRFLFTAGDGDPMHVPSGYGVEQYSALPFLLIGLVALGYGVVQTQHPRRRAASLVLLSALVLYPVPGSLTLPSPHVLRGAHLIPLSALVAAIGAVTLADLIIRLLRTRRPQARRVALLMLTVIACGSFGRELFGFYKDYFHTYPQQVLGQFQYGLEQALSYVHDHADGASEIWISNANEAYIYVLFYERWSPDDVHQYLAVRRRPPAFNTVDTFDKYHFGEPSAAQSKALTILYTISYPNGSPAYEVLGGQTKEHKPIFVIRHP
ncbi:MAG: phospholipid carrier-dependent glycosyltransferase [Herpetosiphonaceae bacterium]|nr:phospholipid carrier-dependent glycosyltransferase [Herpetosiphonaceae bacterium]